MIQCRHILQNDHDRKLISSHFHFCMLVLPGVTLPIPFPTLFSVDRKQSWKPGGLVWGTELRTGSEDTEGKQALSSRARWHTKGHVLPSFAQGGMLSAPTQVFPLHSSFLPRTHFPLTVCPLSSDAFASRSTWPHAGRELLLAAWRSQELLSQTGTWPYSFPIPHLALIPSMRPGEWLRSCPTAGTPTCAAGWSR